MIQINSDKGELNCRGALDTILCEYTLLTRTIFRELKSVCGEEKAAVLFASMGQIAVEEPDEVHNVTKLFDKVAEVIDDEIQV